MKKNLKEIITDMIISKGPIPFENFMRTALYHSELGYYTRRDAKIGREGDFFTASHLGEVFGVLLSKAIKLYLKNLNVENTLSIAEVGPGMGYLAYDILNELINRDKLNFSINYNLIEINQNLIKVQRERLSKFSSIARWYNDLESLEQIEGVFICNEIFDALPVRLFEIRNRQVYEVYVSIDGNNELSETLLSARQDLTEFVEKRIPHLLEFEGYRSEVCFGGKFLLELMWKVLKRGYLIVIDYGYDMDEYYAPERNRGTLLCYHKHMINENPYENIGLQDITCHVNFSLLREWAEELGFRVLLYQSQSHFLVSLCDEETLERFKEQGLIQKLKRLVLPQGMGDTHRVMVMSKGVD